MQEAVLNKILLDGFGVTANLYSNYAETYIHHEKKETKTENTEVDENKPGKSGNLFFFGQNSKYFVCKSIQLKMFLF